MPLDLAHLTPAASLNRVPFVALAGVPLAPQARGKPAFALLSADALRQAVRAAAGALGLAGAATAGEDDLLPAFDACFTADDPGVRAAAAAIARAYAGHLAYLLLTLRRGEPAARQARPDWDDSFWSHWAGVRHVWLGGGLVAGQLGRAVEREAAAILGAEDPPYSVAVAPHPRLLPLIGAARSVPAPTGLALVWDFGATAIKRAQVEYRAGALAGMRVLPPLPSALPGDPSGAAPARLAARIVDILAGDWTQARAAGADPAPVLLASMACYLRDGQPLTGQIGAYAELNTLSDNLAGLLADAVGRRTGRPLAVTLIHDGTAAARACAGPPGSAVIMLGTALGSGFPPEGTAGLRPLAPGFAVTHVTSTAGMDYAQVNG